MFPPPLNADSPYDDVQFFGPGSNINPSSISAGLPQPTVLFVIKYILSPIANTSLSLHFPHPKQYSHKAFPKK